MVYTAKPKISAIIPVYNSQQYLKNCLDSILNQDLQELELICVNDGSSDNSLNILNDYAKKDSRIKILNQQNQGQGAARNKGIKAAKGEYLIFVDSDDMIESSSIRGGG